MKRRNFIKSAVKFGIAAGFPTIIPATVLGKNGAIAPSERITMGSIGLGIKGMENTRNFFSDKRVQIVGLCDVNNTEGRQYYGYQNNGDGRGLRAARREFGQDIPAYTDFRELLARKDVDTITTALPDHWHAIVDIACMRANKDVYGEKPLTRTIREGIVLRDAFSASGRIWQTGSWMRSLPNVVRAAEIVRNGYLGEVKKVEIRLPANFKAEILRPEPVPDGLDWDLWQGPAQPSFYNPRKVFTRWRGITNYCAGKIADWGAHHLDIAHWALGFDNSGPIEVSPIEVKWPKSGFSDQPLGFKVALHYKGGVEIRMSEELSQDNCGTRFIGTKGSLFISLSKFYSDPIELCDIRIPPTDQRLFPIRSGNHFTAFIDSVLDRRTPVTDIKIAHRTNTGCLLAEIAYRLNRNIHWDPLTEKIIGDPQAEKLCDRAYRAPWQLQA